MKKTLRIFISSPSDLEVERQIALQVIRRLESKYQNHLILKPVLWEREPLLASGHFQDALDPSTADIMMCMLWSRLGSPLPENFTGVDGRSGLTGSEWEFEYGLKAFEKSGSPELLVYRKTTDVQIKLDDKASAEKAIEQKLAVEQFFQTHFHNQDTDNTFKRAYFPFDATYEFEQLLETHLAPLLEKHLNQDAETGINTPTWFEGSPFLGLSAFHEKHHAIFFGRTKALGELMTQYKRQVLQQKGFVMVTGMSGCGKSSLVNAGILPLIRTPRVISYEVGYIEVIHTRPQQFQHALGPLTGLCATLINHVPAFANLGVDAETLCEQITQSPKSLKATINQICQSLASAQSLHEKVEAKIQIVIDQAEEVFTTKAFSIKQQQAFWLGISTLIDTGFVWCLGSMRSDFVGQGQGSELYELMRGDGDYKLQPPSISEYQQIIEKPAKAAGLTFEVNNDGTSLATVIREDSEAQPGALPLVEFCLDELFRITEATEDAQLLLTFHAYNEVLGGLAGSITQRAESVVVNLKQQGIDVKQHLPTLFNALVQVNPDNQHEAATARNIHADFFADNQAIQPIIEALIKSRLITVSDKKLRIAHETLIHNWQRIQQWLAMDKEFQMFKARIERDVAIWIQEGKAKSRLLNKGKPLSDAQSWFSQRNDDLNPDTASFIKASITKSKRQGQQKAIFLSITILILSGLSVYSWIQQSTATKQREIASN